MGSMRGGPALDRLESTLFLVLLNVTTFKGPGLAQRVQALADINRHIGVGVRPACIVDANEGIFFFA